MRDGSMNETMSLSKHEENQIILYPKLCKFTNSLVCPILNCLNLFYILFAMNVIHMAILKALYIQLNSFIIMTYKIFQS